MKNVGSLKIKPGLSIYDLPSKGIVYYININCNSVDKLSIIDIDNIKIKFKDGRHLLIKDYYKRYFSKCLNKALIVNSLLK